MVKREVPRPTWECKECHRMIADNETVAYHLIDRILYGWCDGCFSLSMRRAKKIFSERALAVPSS